jgi:hypothetical protein
MGYTVVLLENGYTVVGEKRPVSLRFAERALERLSAEHPKLHYVIREDERFS